MFVKNLEKYNPKNEYSLFIKEYFLEMKKFGVKKYINNIDVDIKFIEFDDFLVPLSFGNNNDNCYTTSILGCLKYLKEELKNEKNFLKRFFYHIFINILLIILKFFKIEENIFVFNLFLSTILYPEISEKTIIKINNFLKENFPNKAIIYRGINSNITTDIKEILEKEKFSSIVTRQIFYLEKNNFLIFSKKKSFIKDKNICKKFNFSMKKSNFSKQDIIEMKQFYDDLYLKKYSFSNPQFSIEFFEKILKNQFFSLNLLQNNKGENEAVFGTYTINKKSTNPIFGYNIKNNKEKYLYGQLTYFSIIEIFKNSEILNLSSGVGKFKMHRGAKMDLEYTFVFWKHLSFFRKIPWKILQFISKKIIEKEFKNNIY